MSEALLSLAARLLGKRVRIARRNLELCFPDLDAAQRERLVRENVRESLRGGVGMLRAWYASPEKLLGEKFAIEGIEHLQRARDEGRGVLLLCSHFVHVELALRVLSLSSGFTAHAMVRGGKRLGEAIQRRGRGRIVKSLIRKNDARALLDALRGGDIVVYLGDQDFRWRNAFVPFFGVPAATLTAAPELAARGDALLLPMFCWRDGGGVLRIRIDAPWREQGAEFAARYMRELEAVVRKHPAQYLWLHRRFKTRPQGEPSLY